MGRGDVLRSFGTKRKWNESSSPHCNLHSPRFVQLGWKFRSRSPAAPRVVFQFRSPSLEKHRFVRWNAWTIEALEFPSFSCFSYSIGHDSISMYRFTRSKGVYSKRAFRTIVAFQLIRHDLRLVNRIKSYYSAIKFHR